MEPLVVKTVLNSTKDKKIVSLATGCLEVASTKYPNSAWKVSTIHSAFGNTAATMAGIETAFNVLKRKKKIKEDIKFLVVAGDGGTYDIGLQALSGAMERGHDFVFLCLDNGAYMNTGGQRSSSTPYGSITSTTPSGKLSFRKDLVKIANAHDIPYIAQASIFDLEDLKMKAKKAFSIKGPSLINVLVPCIRFWRFNIVDLKKINETAIKTNFWPLYEIENGKVKINYKTEKRLPIEEFLKLQGRFKHLDKKQIKIIQEKIDRDYEELLKRDSNSLI